MEGNFFVAARVVIPHMAVDLSFYFDELRPVRATPIRPVVVVVGSSLLLSAPWKFQEPKTIGSGSMHHPFMHVWCEIGIAVVERMDYLFCTVFAWKLTNKKFETVAI
jgi:hypothetical protein